MEEGLIAHPKNINEQYSQVLGMIRIIEEQIADLKNAPPEEGGDYATAIANLEQRLASLRAEAEGLKSKLN